MSSAASLASKFRGCLVGSHVGDCFGEPFEFANFTKQQLVDHVSKWSQDVAKDVTDDPRAFSFYGVQDYTDDTEMTLSIANSLVENKGFAAKDMATRFVEEYETTRVDRGYGLHVVVVFSALRKTNFADPFGPATAQFNGSGSYGNGAPMRVAPVALYTYNGGDEDAIKLAKDQSLITHTHRNGYNGAILQCLAIRQALKTKSDEAINPLEFIDNLIVKMTKIEDEELPNDPGLSEEDKRPYCSGLKRMREIIETAKCVSPDEAAKILGNNVTAQKSVPIAIYSFLKSLQPCDDFKHPDQFVRAMYHAVSVKGDTDTIAAMTGSISGAYHGIEGIPKCFQLKCEFIKKSEQAAERLYELCCGN